ncbi:hypothetical protein BZA70DRAFT_242233 [Myxozyma melibiosi]|uniref:RRM domain-containing protein n=1 Tax=Myxozyma melibiosi TaxID=54550 RepID=A0ABR1EYY4_9ASCO
MDVDEQQQQQPEDHELEIDAEKFADLLEAVLTNKYKYTAHAELLSFLKQAGPESPLADELREARERMAGVFLMDSGFWNSWLDDEEAARERLREGEGVDEDGEAVKLLEVYTKSVDDLVSVQLWERYLGFLIGEYEREKKEGKDEEARVFSKAVVEAETVRAVDATQYLIPDVSTNLYSQSRDWMLTNTLQSHRIWNIYRDMKLEDLAAKPTIEAIALVKRYYLSRLKIPHAALSETFSDYSTFITTYANDNYEKELVAANKLVSETKQTLAVLQPYEDHLAEHPDDLGVWSQYIDASLARPKKVLSFDLTKAIYERAIANSPTSAAVWDSYVLFLLDHDFQYDTVNAVLARAVRACPKSGALWAHFIRTRERFGASPDAIVELTTQVFGDDLLSSSVEDYSLAVAAWLAYIRHQSAEVGEESAYYAEVDKQVDLYREKFGNESSRRDQKYVIPQLYIASLTARGEIGRAREEWEVLTKKHARESEFWMKRFSWERAVCEPQGDHLTPAGVLTSAVGVKSIDQPERVCDALLGYQREVGSAFAIEKAEIAVKKLMRVVQKRRATEAAAAAAAAAAASKTVKSHTVDKKKTEEEEVEEEEKPATNGKRKDAPVPTAEVSVKKAKTTTSAPVRDREHLSVIAEGISGDATEKEVAAFFKDCGEIISMKLVSVDGQTTATLEFGNDEDVLSALTRDQKPSTVGSTITVRRAINSTLWITNFPSAADEGYIRGLFEKFGEVVDVRFPSLSVNTKRRFCYLQYATAEAAEKAEAEKQPKQQRKLIVKISDPSQRRNRQGAVYEGRELFVRSIPYSMKDADVLQMFSKYGAVERVRLPTATGGGGSEKVFGNHQGFGFVTFSKAEEAERALELNLTKVGDRVLSVVLAEVKAPASSTDHHQSSQRGRGRGRGRGGRGRGRIGSRVSRGGEGSGTERGSAGGDKSATTTVMFVPRAVKQKQKSTEAKE